MQLTTMVIFLVLIIAQMWGLFEMVVKSFPKNALEIKSTFLFSGLNSFATPLFLPNQGSVSLGHIFDALGGVGIGVSLVIGIYCIAKFLFFHWKSPDEISRVMENIFMSIRGQAVKMFILSLTFFWLTLMPSWAGYFLKY